MSFCKSLFFTLVSFFALQFACDIPKTWKRDAHGFKINLYIKFLTLFGTGKIAETKANSGTCDGWMRNNFASIWFVSCDVFAINGSNYNIML